VMGRNTQGVRLIALANNEKLVGMERILEEKGEDEDEADGEETAGDGDE
jgi:DNA gyrase subunit A